MVVGARRVAAVVAVACLAVACTPDPDRPDAVVEPTTEPTTTTSAEDESRPPASVVPDDQGAATVEGPLADTVFLTAVDEVVAGTTYEGLVDATPGEFLLTAQLVCERLADGADRTDLLQLYLDALGAGQPSEEDARLAGALVGAGVQVYCPDHAE